MPAKGKPSKITLPRSKRKAKSPSPQCSPPPPTSKKPKTKVSAATRSNFKRVSTYDRSTVFEIIAGFMDRAQHLSRKSKVEPNRLLTEFQDNYYMVEFPDRTLQELAEHQKYVAGITWRMMLPVYSIEKGRYSDGIIRFFNALVLQTGLEEQLLERDIEIGSLVPFFIHVLKCILTCHCDQRAPVRVRVAELLHLILSNFNDDPVILQFSSLRQLILTAVLKHRVRDKIAAVRVQALKCLRYFEDEPSLKKTLILVVNNDPNDEARKAAVRVLGSCALSSKSSVLTDKIYDRADVVRAEAFEGLSNIPLAKIRDKTLRESIVHWGLIQSSANVRKIVKDKLITAWLRECHDNLINLFCKLDIAVKPKTAHLLVDALYPDPSHEVFETIDISFLGAEKVVPLNEFSTEKTLLWFLLCAKFKDSHTCLEKLLPEPIFLCSYIESIVKDIREECIAAKAEEREEEYTKVLGLAHILRILEFLPVEESAKRKFIEILKNILVDSTLEDAIIVNVAIDMTAKLMKSDGDCFERTMSVIVAEIFGEEEEIHSQRFSQDSNETLFSRRPREREFMPLSPSNMSESSCIIKPGVSNAKGLVILTRTLSWTKKISGTIRTIYNEKIINSLEDEDGRIRGFTLALCGMIGITERAEARKAFMTLMQALDADTDEFVQETGFKALIDLLLHYRLEVFQTANILSEDSFLPPPFNDPDASPDELQSKMISVLQSYGGEAPSDRVLLRRVTGLVKLLLRGRFTNVDLITHLIAIWSSSDHQGSQVYTLINKFVHYYSTLYLGHAYRIAASLIPSLKNVIESNEEPVHGGLGAAVDQVSELIIRNTSPAVLSRHRNAHMVHEQIGIDILEAIQENVFLKDNSYLAQGLKFLDIVEKESATKLWKICDNILEALSSSEVRNDGLKTGIKSFMRYLYKKFGDFDLQNENKDTERENPDQSQQLINSQADEEDTDRRMQSMALVDDDKEPGVTEMMNYSLSHLMDGEDGVEDI